MPTTSFSVLFLSISSRTQRTVSFLADGSGISDRDDNVNRIYGGNTVHLRLDARMANLYKENTSAFSRKCLSVKCIRKYQQKVKRSGRYRALVEEEVLKKLRLHYIYLVKSLLARRET